MANIDLEIKIDSDSIRLEYCLIEGKKLNPENHFAFKNGNWVGRFNNFPIDTDNGLSIFILAAGNPNTNSKMTIAISGNDKGVFSLFKPFNRNGYGQFNQDISL